MPGSLNVRAGTSPRNLLVRLYFWQCVFGDSGEIGWDWHWKRKFRCAQAACALVFDADGAWTSLPAKKVSTSRSMRTPQIMT